MELMDHGSLADLIQNDTVALDGEILLGFMRDISQGMRYLHSSSPQVIHGYVQQLLIEYDAIFRL